MKELRVVLAKLTKRIDEKSIKSRFENKSKFTGGKKMKSKLLASFFCFMLLSGSFFSFLSVNALSPLKLNLTVDQPVYRLRYTPPSVVNIGGNLTLDGTLVSDGLVAVSVLQRNSSQFVHTVLFRTLTTGSLPSQNWNLNVSLETVGWVGAGYTPKTVFHRPSSQQDLGPAFNVTIKNTHMLESLYVTLTIFDSAMVPIKAIEVYKYLNYSQPILPNSTIESIVPPIPLADWVGLGNATVYVCAFDNVPPYIYYPLCPEVSQQFTVVPTGGAQSLSQGSLYTPSQKIFQSPAGSYNLTFALDYRMVQPSSAWGNYTVKVSSEYQGNTATNAYVFWARIPGDVNGDGKVDIKDVSIIGVNWQKTVPPAAPEADLNQDGKIDIKDVSLVGAYWQKRELT